jgi:hypothetical protein
LRSSYELTPLRILFYFLIFTKTTSYSTLPSLCTTYNSDIAYAAGLYSLPILYNFSYTENNPYSYSLFFLGSNYRFTSFNHSSTVFIWPQQSF